MPDFGMDPRGRQGSLTAPAFLAATTGAAVSFAGALAAQLDSEATPSWYLVAGASFLCALPLYRAGRVQAAGRVVFSTALALCAWMVFTRGAGGLDPRSLVILPVLGISANVLLPRREAILGMGGVLALASVILGADASTGWGTASSPGGGWMGYGVLLLLIGVPSLTSRLLVDASAKMTERAREYEMALGLANDCLQAEASRREALIQELEARNAELERFCFTVSHDLKNPLVTIGGFLGYVERSAEKGDVTSVRLDLERIGRAHQKMLKLLDDLLELSRAGRELRRSEDVPLGEVVQEALELCHGAITLRNARLVVGTELPIVHGDRLRMVQVFQNLIDNAVKYSNGEAPVVEIGARHDALKELLFVRDSGIGIDPIHHERIFQLFETLNPGGSGSGVGLALVKRIVESHGGRVWLESEGLGHGSTFWFTLPRAVGPAA